MVLVRLRKRSGSTSHLGACTRLRGVHRGWNYASRDRGPGSETEENHMLWSLDSNASLTLIAERLGRTVAAVRKKLRNLGYTAESLGGFKVKDVAEMFLVCPARIQDWVAEKHLLTKGGRITESSFSKFLADHSEKVPFEMLSVDMQNWLREMGYPDRKDELKANRGNTD